MFEPSQKVRGTAASSASCCPWSHTNQAAPFVSRSSEKVTIKVRMHLALHILRCPGCMIIIELDLEYVIYIAILRGCDCSRRDLQHTTPHTQLLPAQNSPPKIMSRLISLPSMLTTWQSGSTSRQLLVRLHVTANSCLISWCWHRC